MPNEYVDMRYFSDQLGLTINTVRKRHYEAVKNRQVGRPSPIDLPAPDGPAPTSVGKPLLWLRNTADAYIAGRRTGQRVEVRAPVAAPTATGSPVGSPVAVRGDPVDRQRLQRPG